VGNGKEAEEQQQSDIISKKKNNLPILDKGNPDERPGCLKVYEEKPLSEDW